MKINRIIDIANKKIEKLRSLEDSFTPIKMYLKVLDFEIESLAVHTNSIMLYEDAILSNRGRCVRGISVNFPVFNKIQKTFFQRIIFIDKDYTYEEKQDIFIYCNKSDILYRRKIGLYEPKGIVEINQEELVKFNLGRLTILKSFELLGIPLTNSL